MGRLGERMSVLATGRRSLLLRAVIAGCKERFDLRMAFDFAGLGMAGRAVNSGGTAPIRPSANRASRPRNPRLTSGINGLTGSQQGHIISE